jgi:hypothetical protein
MKAKRKNAPETLCEPARRHWPNFPATSRKISSASSLSAASWKRALEEFGRKPLLHGEQRRRRHILPFDEQFSLAAAGARQRDLDGFDGR